MKSKMIIFSMIGLIVLIAISFIHFCLLINLLVPDSIPKYVWQNTIKQKNYYLKTYKDSSYNISQI